MRSELISCVIPAYNCERYLGEAVDSVLAQTYRPLEIHVVDDGSTDGTAQVAAGYGTKISYLRQKNRGPAAARNAGVSVADGEFVAFLDADDRWHPEKLERQMGRLAERSEIDLCFTGLQHFWIEELAEEGERYEGHPLSRPFFAYHISALLAHRSAFTKFGAFDESIRAGENMTWFLHAANQGAVIEVLPHVLVYRRFHGDSFTRTAESKELLNSFFPILKAWRDYQQGRAKE
jgi:glycosyltransferase involved in cell wall biosynthesis